MKPEELDRIIKAGEEQAGRLEPEKVRRPGREQKRVNVDFPLWMVQALDREAGRLGVSRQAVIKMWLAERLGRGHQASNI